MIFNDWSDWLWGDEGEVGETIMSAVDLDLEFIKSYDSEVGNAIERELCRQRSNIELIASENFVSPAVLVAMGSVLTNKYAEGYPAHRYYGGCQ